MLSERDYFLLEITIAAPASATPASARPAVAPVAAVLSEAAAEDVAVVVVVPAFEDVVPAAVEDVAAAEDLSSFLDSSFLESVPDAVESVPELDSSATGFF